MALDQTKVAVAVTGLISRAPLGTTAPTTQATTLNASFVDLGYIGEDGVTQTLPASGDATPIKAWQGGATVRVVRTAPDDLPTFHFVALETNKGVVESWAGATVTQTVTEGSVILNTLTTRTHYSWVIDVIDGSDLERIYIPDGLVTDVGDRVYANQEAIGYELTIEAQYNATLVGQAKLWSTRLHT